MFLKMHVLVTLVVVPILGAIAQSTAPVPIVGDYDGITKSGSRPERLNINDIYAQGGPAWDLYIQGLAAMQAVNESHELSYFQVMGIHGVPLIPWNGVEQVPGGSGGYCPHGQIIFGTWHRPFIALYEQTLATLVYNIAKQYDGSQGASYRAAAENFRVAFWDWAADPTLPDAVTDESVTVNTPSGPKTIHNPLYSYRFQSFPFSLPGMVGDGGLAADKETKRCPDSDGVSNSTQANTYLASDNLKDFVYQVFTTIQPFQNMTSTQFSGYNFEAPHNIIHNNVGCSNGHMFDIWWSAFDPIFMLHHANVDRLIALWQAIYYNESMFNVSADAGATFAFGGGTVDANTPLTPFYDANDRFYTSNTVTKISKFGYTYPEINDWDLTPDELSKSVRNQVNTLYGREQPASSRLARKRDYTRAPLKHYSVSIGVDRSEIELPATINIYLANKPAGKMALLSMPMEGMAYSVVPLASALDAVHIPRHASTDVVMPFLEKNFRVEIRTGNGTLVPSKTVPSLDVSIQDQDFVQREDDCEFPTYGRPRRWPTAFRKDA